jgi:hypothetical protein
MALCKTGFNTPENWNCPMTFNENLSCLILRKSVVRFKRLTTTVTDRERKKHDLSIRRSCVAREEHMRRVIRKSCRRGQSEDCPMRLLRC